MFIYMDFLFYYNCDDDREKMGGDTGREKGGATTTGGGQGPRYIHFSYLFITLLTTIYRPLYRVFIYITTEKGENGADIPKDYLRERCSQRIRGNDSIPI